MRRVVVMIAVGVFLVGFTTVASADEGPNLSFGASVSYSYDLDNDQAVGSVDAQNVAALANMEQGESFNVDLVQIGVSGDRGAVSYGAKISIGDLADGAGDTDSGDVLLQEAYLAYDAGGATVTAGRFGTPIGYEVLEPWGNDNISRSMSWGMQPVNHDGVTISTAVGAADVTFGVVNGFTVDGSTNDGDDEMGLIGSLGCSIGDMGLNISAVYTEEGDTTDETMVNAILSGDAGDIAYAIEVNLRETDATAKTSDTSLVLYAATSLGNTDLDLRFEWVDDEVTATDDNEIWSVTATLSWELADGVDFRLEYRHDDSDDNIFGNAADNDADSLDLVQAQLVWAP
mgnify:CR=1 FL=1